MQFRERSLNCGCKNKNLNQFYHVIMRIKSLIILILLTGLGKTVLGAENNGLLKADSLFKSQKYTEAFSIYKELMDQGDVSSSMLLKMAFIQDASEDYAEALYYLDLYYRMSADRQAVGKIEEIAKEHELNGYQYDDSQYFLALYQKFKIHIVVLLLSISLLLLVYVFTKYKKEEKAYIPAVFQVFTILLLLVVVNFQASTRGIIINDQTLLRSGPSAGAEPVEILSRGHKVTVVNQSEVWTKILWNGEEVFVRNSRLKLI